VAAIISVNAINYTVFTASAANTSAPVTLHYNVTSPRGLTAILVACGGGRCDSTGAAQAGHGTLPGTYIGVPAGCTQQRLMDIDGNETAGIFTCPGQAVGQYSVTVNPASGSGNTSVSIASYVFRNGSLTQPPG
jgi:hypothetical protein